MTLTTCLWEALRLEWEVMASGGLLEKMKLHWSQLVRIGTASLFEVAVLSQVPWFRRLRHS